MLCSSHLTRQLTHRNKDPQSHNHLAVNEIIARNGAGYFIYACGSQHMLTCSWMHSLPATVLNSWNFSPQFLTQTACHSKNVRHCCRNNTKFLLELDLNWQGEKCGVWWLGSILTTDCFIFTKKNTGLDRQYWPMHCSVHAYQSTKANDGCTAESQRIGRIFIVDVGPNKSDRRSTPNSCVVWPLDWIYLATNVAAICQYLHVVLWS